MSKSIKQIVKEVKDICDSHGQIRSFHYGDTLHLLQNGAIEYATVLMNITRSSLLDSNANFTLDILVLDRVITADDNNQLDSENITHRVIQDITNVIGYSTRWRTFSELKTSSSTQKYIDSFSDAVTGHSVSIALDTYNDFGVCDLPIFDYDFNQPIPIDECDVLAVVRNTDGTQLVSKIVSDSDGIITVPDIIFTDSNGNTSSVASGVNITATQCEVPSDATVHSTNNYYNTTVPSGGDLEVPDSIVNVNGSLFESLEATKPLSIRVVNENDQEIGSKQSNDVIIDNFPILNSDDSYSVSIPVTEDGFTLPDRTDTDSDGSPVVNPAQVPMICTPIPNDLVWTINFREQSEKEIIPCIECNVGILDSGSGNDFGTITVSTDDIVYSALVFPFTPIVGNTYYFKRSTFLVSGDYEMEGKRTNKINTWELNFEDLKESIKVECTALNASVFSNGFGENTGTIEVSTDDISYIPLAFPFTAAAGTDYYFRRNNALTTSRYIINGYGFSSVAESFVFTGSYKKNEVVLNGLERWLVGGVGVSGVTVADQSGNNNDFTLINGTTTNIDSFQLDGVSQYILTNMGNQLNEETISITVEYDSITLGDRIIGQLTNVSGQWGVRISGATATAGTMEMYTNPIWSDLILTPVVSVKYTFDFVIDNINSIIKLYIDGVLITTVLDNLTYTDIGLGCKYRSLFDTTMHGKIYDFKHYNRLLTNSEIIQNYNSL